MERGSTSKRRPNFDYISSMPDPILQRILSLLETREAVQTCILSKRWINVWTSLSSLSFDFPFIRSEPFSKRHGDKTDDVVFERFVSMVLHRSEPCDLHRFHLNTRYAWSIDDGCIMEWIHYALRHNVRKLHFSTSTFKSLPILNCSSLEMRSTGDEVINLPNLKELNLTEFILDASFSKRLFLGCPALEYLSLEDCPFENCHLSSNKLKRLRINFISSIDDFRFVASKNFGVRISAPNLTFICFDGEPEVFQNTMFENTFSLLHLHINFCNFHYTERNPWKSFFTISSLKHLKISDSSCKDILEEQAPKLSVFTNLESLSNGRFCFACHFYTLARILEHSPNLKKLTVKHDGRNCQMHLHTEKGSRSIDGGSTHCFCSEVKAPCNSLRNQSLTNCKNLSEIEVKYYSNDGSVKLLLDSLVDITMELANIKIVLSMNSSTNSKNLLCPFV